MNANFKINISWIPSHIGLSGNERADLIAKQTLQFRQITIIPISQKTIRRMIKNLINQKWQYIYDTQHFDGKVKLKIGKYVTESRKIRREEISLCRLRTGKTLITHVLPFINDRFPPLCEECNEILNIEHILISCLTYHRERREIYKYFNENNILPITKFKLLQDDEEIIELLITFLRNIGLLNQI